VSPEPFRTFTGTGPTTAPAMFTVAVSVVSETRVVVSGLLFQRIAAVASNALPVAVIMKLAEPTTALDGASVSRTGGGGGETVNGSPGEGMPEAFRTVTVYVAAGYDAVTTGAERCVPAVTTVVGSVTPFHWITAPASKLFPYAWSVKDGSPTVTPVGLIEIRTGGGAVGRRYPERDAPARALPARAVVVASWEPVIPAGDGVGSSGLTGAPRFA
jgi:hypothetical protein